MGVPLLVPKGFLRIRGVFCAFPAHPNGGIVESNIWLTRKMKATLYDVPVPAINQHLKHI